MARRPRPVNPDEGPIQAFAFDLRALRESAGNPTYRALAKTAGYCATTLGDAAGGVHLPTLEVTLAYVGACGGDADAWHARWQTVNRQLASERAPSAEIAEVAAPADPAPADPAPADPAPADSADAIESALTEPSQQPAASPALDEPADIEPAASMPAGPDAGRRSRKRILALLIVVAAALAGVLAAAGAGAFASPQSASASQFGRHSRSFASPAAAAAAASSSPVGCPARPAAGSAIAFTGTTYGIGANVRRGASLESPLISRVPAGCTLYFSGYCLGDVVQDATAGTPDMRWFIIPGEGEVSSAIVHGDPPTKLVPQQCPDDVPGPASIRLAIAPNGTGVGVAQLTATGSRLWIVGFAAYYADGAPGGPARWHQIGLGTDQSSAFLSSPLRLAPSGPDVPVVAVACLGGDGPTRVLATAAVDPASPRTLRPPTRQSAATLATAEATACEYPGA